MADKRTHLAGFNAKGLEDFVSEDQARVMAETQGDNSLFIVRAQHGRLTRDVDGTERVSLVIGTVALVPEAHQRAVQRLLVALALDTGAEVTLDLDSDGATPSAEDAAAEVDAAADEAGAPAETWDPVAERQDAEDAADAAADPEAPLPDKTDGEEADGPWPGDEGYEAPTAETSPAADDLATQRAKTTRKAATRS